MPPTEKPHAGNFTAARLSRLFVHFGAAYKGDKHEGDEAHEMRNVRASLGSRTVPAQALADGALAFDFRGAREVCDP